MGEETHTLTASEQVNMNVSVSGGLSGASLQLYNRSGFNTAPVPGNDADVTQPSGTVAISGTVSSTGATTNGGGGAHNNMQPTSFLNFMIKL